MKKIVSIVLPIALAIVFNACEEGSIKDAIADLDNNVTINSGTGAPVFSSTTTASVNENQLSAITLSAEDTTTIHYGISESDASFFNVDSATGVVTFKVAPNYEENHNGDHTYSFTATATDTSNNTSSQSITITILDVEPEIITHNGTTYDEVISPFTGKVWLDRNLGASRVCTARTDTACYGDYYQWGRNADGHQKLSSTTTYTKANNVDNVGNSKYILSADDPWEWSSVDANGALRAANWSKTDGSSVCPAGFRVPTISELEAETTVASTPVSNNEDAFNSFLKLPSAGIRMNNSNDRQYVGTHGAIWATNVTADGYSYFLNFNPENSATDDADSDYGARAMGISVRCIKN